MGDLTIGLSLVIMIIGLIGSLIPLLPGPPLIWLGAFLYAWSTNFQIIGWGMLLVLFAIMLVAVTSDVWVGIFGLQQSGASLASSLLSALLGIIGLIIFNVPGMLFGSIFGAIAPDYMRYRDWRRSLRFTKTTLLSWLISGVIQFGLGIVMIVLFLFQAL